MNFSTPPVGHKEKMTSGRCRIDAEGEVPMRSFRVGAPQVVCGNLDTLGPCVERSSRATGYAPHFDQVALLPHDVIVCATLV